MRREEKHLTEKYEAPAIMISDIVIEQNILNNGSGNLQDMPGELW